MKFILFAFGLVIVMGLVAQNQGFLDTSLEVINERTATTTVEIVEEETLPEDWLEEAEKAHQAVIDRKRAEAELEAVQGEIEALRATFTAQEDELLQKEQQLEKELGTY